VEVERELRNVKGRRGKMREIHSSQITVLKPLLSTMNH